MKTTVLVTLLALLAAACSSEQSEGPAPAARSGESTPVTGGPVEVGAEMPAYQADRLGGGTFELAASEGEVVLLNIWATWCGPCRVEIPDLIALQNEFSPHGFNVVGVSIDGAATQAQVEPFAKSVSINYPIVLDPQARIADIFETSVIPTSALIDREGRVVWIDYGPVQAGDPGLRAAIESALGPGAESGPTPTAAAR